MTEISTEIITGRTFEAKMLDDSIYFLHFLPNTHSTVQDYVDGYEAYEKFRQGIPLRVIIENGEYATMDASARLFLQENKFDAIAVAIVMFSVPQRIVYNFYLKFRKQSHPIKAFKSRIKAKEWLNQF